MKYKITIWKTKKDNGRDIESALYDDIFPAVSSILKELTTSDDIKFILCEMPEDKRHISFDLHQIHKIIARHFNAIVCADEIVDHLSKGDVSDAAKAWTRLFRLYERKEPDQNEVVTALNTVSLQNVLSSLDNDTVFVVTDYLKDKYYKKYA